MVNAPGNDTAALEKLAAELTARGYEARLIAPDGRPPWLAVITAAATMLADRIAPAADVAAAAAAITRVLALAPAGDGE
jgi:uncharacterized NAD-dependent epimerase/dehydratase family protein